ncbi:glycosyltransferase family 2 protein [Kaarinaea lacus]
MKFAIVIPAYNEAATIRSLAVACRKQFDNVIIVDDGSSDDTSGQLKGLDICLLKNEHNVGKAASLWRGFNAARDQLNVDAIITMDGDGQHKPDDINNLCRVAEQHPNHVVIAARLLNTENAPRARLFANRFADFWVSWAAGQRIVDSQSGFRIYPCGLLDAVKVSYDKKRGFVFESEILIEAVRAGFPCISSPIESIYHSGARASHFRPVVDISRIVLMVAWKLIKWGMYPKGLLSFFSTKKRATATSPHT